MVSYCVFFNERVTSAAVGDPERGVRCCHVQDVVLEEDEVSAGTAGLPQKEGADSHESPQRRPPSAAAPAPPETPEQATEAAPRAASPPGAASVPPTPDRQA